MATVPSADSPQDPLTLSEVNDTLEKLILATDAIGQLVNASDAFSDKFEDVFLDTLEDENLDCTDDFKIDWNSDEIGFSVLSSEEEGSSPKQMEISPELEENNSLEMSPEDNNFFSSEEEGLDQAVISVENRFLRYFRDEEDEVGGGDRPNDFSFF